MDQEDPLLQSLYTNDSSLSFKKYLKSQKADIKISVECNLTMSRVTTPVRHNPGSDSREVYTGCLFELENILLFLQEEKQEQFKCPACHQMVKRNSFGIDRLFFHILSLTKFYNFNDAKIYQKIILYQVSTKKFLVLHKKTDERTEIQGIRCNQGAINALKENINQIESIIVSKIQNCTKAAQSFDLYYESTTQMIEAQTKLTLNQVLNLIPKHMGLKDVGSANPNQFEAFCFGLYKIQRLPQQNSIFPPDPIQSMLITFFPRQRIWHDFLLQKRDGTDFMYNEASLALKANDQAQINQIFLLGGFRQKAHIGSVDFYEIQFPKDHLTQQNQKSFAQIKVLPDLPYKCCLPMAVYDDKKIYLLGGVEFIKEDQVEMNSNLYIFDQGKWQLQQCKQPLTPRVDGTIHFDRKSKLVAILGGFKFKNSYKQYDLQQESVRVVDIISLKDFKVRTIGLNFGRHDMKILTNKCLVRETDSSQILIFNGKCLKEDQKSSKSVVADLLFKSEVFLGHNEDFTKRSVYLVDRVASSGLYEMNQIRSQMLIYDYEGVVLDNIFYTVYCRPDNLQRQYEFQKIQLSAYQYDLGTGKNQFIVFPGSNKSIEKAKTKIEKSTQQETLTRPFDQLQLK